MPSEALSNLAEYEGFLEVEESTITELQRLAQLIQRLSSENRVVQ